MSEDRSYFRDPVGEQYITNVRGRDQLFVRTENLPVDQKLAINNQGLELELILRKWTGKQDAWGILKDKKVLDLASGSALNSAKWHPYFARLCAFNGANVTAVDVSPQIDFDAKLFKEVKGDIVEAVVNRKLEELVGEKEFDIVHSSSFIGFNPSPDLLSKLDTLHISIEDFHKAFFQEAANLLAEGGIMSLDERTPQIAYYTKKEGRITEL